MPYQLPPPSYPQFFKYFKSIYLSLSIYQLTFPFPKYQYIIDPDPGAGIGPCYNRGTLFHLMPIIIVYVILAGAVPPSMAH